MASIINRVLLKYYYLRIVVKMIRNFPQFNNVAPKNNFIVVLSTNGCGF